MEEQKKSNGPKVVIGVLLLVVAILAYMLTSTKGEVTNVTEEKERLVFDLQEMKRSLEDRESDNDSLDSYIVEEIQRLQLVIDSVEGLNDADAKTIKKYKNRVWSYKQREKKFISQIDSINAAYEVMRMEKERAEMNLFEEQQRNMELNTENRSLQRDLAVGSMLQATVVESKGAKV
jgi:chromosome segregation ATPase